MILFSFLSMFSKLSLLDVYPINKIFVIKNSYLKISSYNIELHQPKDKKKKGY